MVWYTVAGRVGTFSLPLSFARARYWITRLPSPSPPSARVELEHAVTEASSTCFLEIDTLPSHGRHAHHRRPRQPSESRSSPVGDPSCSSSSSLSCSLLLSSTSSSSLPVRARPPFDRVRRLQRRFPLSCYELSNGKQKFPLPLISCRLLFSFLFFIFLSPISFPLRFFVIFLFPFPENIYFKKTYARISFLSFFIVPSSGYRFFPGQAEPSRGGGGGGEDFTGGREDRIVNDTARCDDKSLPSPSCPYANGRNYKRRAGCSVIILTFNCSIPRDK